MQSGMGRAVQDYLQAGAPGLHVTVDDESSDWFEPNEVGDHLGVEVGKLAALIC